MRKQMVRDGTELTDDATRSLPASLAAYCDKLKQWRALQPKIMPLLSLSASDGDGSMSLDDDDDDDEGGEVVVLGLPSDFNGAELKQYNLRLLATYELKICIGLAFDRLEEVRQSVRHGAVFLDSKKTHASGTKAHTRANTEIAAARRLTQRLADRYNHNFERISTLRLLLDSKSTADNVSSRLQLINKKSDLSITSLHAPHTEGDSRRSGSWIWAVFETPPEAKKRQSSRKRTVEGDPTPATSTSRPQWLTCGK